MNLLSGESKLVRDKCIGIIVYGNPDYCLATINPIKLLENEYRIAVFSRNEGHHLEVFGRNTIYYRFGKHVTVEENERKSIVTKLFEYLLFTLKVIYYSTKQKCNIVITYDNCAFTIAMILKLCNSQIKIFYHAHEIAESGSNKWHSLNYWTDKIAHRYVKHCVWVSQPDIKMVQLFQKLAHVENVKLLRNFASRDSRPFIKKHSLCENLKRDGYVISVYTGTIGKDCYIEELIQFTRTCKKKIAIVVTGFPREKSIENILKDIHRHNGSAKLIYLGLLPRDEMYMVLNSANFALVLYKYNFMTKMNAGSSVKAGEYIAFGLPMIYPSFLDYEPYYKEVGISYNDGKELIEGIKEMAKNEDLRKKLSHNAKGLFRERLYFENEFSQFKEKIDHYMQ